MQTEEGRTGEAGGERNGGKVGGSKKLQEVSSSTFPTFVITHFQEKGHELPRPSSHKPQNQVTGILVHNKPSPTTKCLL